MKKKTLNVPTILTLIRIILVVPLLILMLSDGIVCKILAIVCFVAASLTDFVDGRLARKNHQVTDLGAFLDPLADKMLVNLTFLVLVYMGYVPLVAFAIILVRDFAVDGMRMMVARRGETVERESRECEIFSLEAEELCRGETKIFVTCSEGTYIRTLISDIGDRLGTGAVMTSLRRTSACSLDISSCITLEQLQAHAENGTLNDVIIPVEKMLEVYPSVNVTKPQGTRFLNGGELSRDRINIGGADGFVRVYCDGNFIGIGELSKQSDSLAVKRVYSE